VAYTITVKTTGTCLAHFQTQDSHEERGFGDIESAKNWLIENIRLHNGVDITVDDIAIYEEVRHPVRLVKPARSKRSLEQRIVELEARLAALTASASNPPTLK
jgi:hypothetical protein